MKIINSSGNMILGGNVSVAKTFFGRLKGLMFRNRLDDGEGLLIVPCSMIHTFFMKISIDVLFLDGQGTVIYIMENLPPWKCSPPVSKAASVLELPAGTVKKTGTCTKDRLIFD